MKREYTPQIHTQTNQHQNNQRRPLTLLPRKRTILRTITLLISILILLVLLFTTTSSRTHTTTLLARRQTNMTSYMIPPASEFSPDNVQWFHAVNSEAKLATTISVIKKEHQKYHASHSASGGGMNGSSARQQQEPWFGIEVDVRTTSNTLILSHDPPVVGYVSNLLGRAFGLDTLLQMVQANLLLGEGRDGSNTATSSSPSSPSSPQPALIIKLDVKDQDSLDAISRDIVASLVLVSGTPSSDHHTTSKAVANLIPPQLFIHKYSSSVQGEGGGSGGREGVPRTQVWLNYDVIPYSQQHPPANPPSLVRPFKEVAMALQTFRSSQHQKTTDDGSTPTTQYRHSSSIGFSLGWISTAEGGRYTSKNADVAGGGVGGLPVYQPHHYTAMLEFLKSVFPSTSKDTNNKKEMGEGHTPPTPDPFILTFALRFSLVDYTTLQSFFEDLESYWKTSGRDQEGYLKLFPTLWRGRTEAISDVTRKRLEDDARLHKTIACVDQE